MIATKIKEATSTRKFKAPSAYINYQGEYLLLPFRFKQLTASREILVNDVGDYLIVPSGTVARIVKKSIDKTMESDLYADLLSHFFITETVVPALMDILSTRYRTKKSFLDHFTSLHIFVITLRCDHTCHYCQVSRVSADKDMFDMKYGHIDKGIDIMFQSPSPSLAMEFQGGEALLAFDKISYAILRAKDIAIEKQKHITFVICTNLALITQEALDFCIEHEVLLSTSLDGPDFIHNQNRYRPGRNSHQLAVEGITKARNAIGEDRVSALLTTTNLSLQYPDEIVDEYYSLGFKSIFLRPISPYGFAVKNETKNHYDIEAFISFYKKALQRIIAYNMEGNFFREDYATILLKKILTPFPVGYVDLQSPAGMINNVIVFNYNGDIYASDEARMLAEMKDYTFKLGSLDTHSYNDIFYGEKAKQFSLAWLNESLPGCSECAYQAYCGADPVVHYATQGDMFGHRPTSTFCKKNMSIIEHLFELMENKKIARIFRSWISGRN